MPEFLDPNQLSKHMQQDANEKAIENMDEWNEMESDAEFAPIQILQEVKELKAILLGAIKALATPEQEEKFKKFLQDYNAKQEGGWPFKRGLLYANNVLESPERKLI